MASISSTSSLGNTSLRGYGGMASGIDRDAIIEQMTLATNTKITNQENAITKLEWKQEAFRGISDKILDLHDNYFSYTATNSLKDPNTYAKTLISMIGKSDSTRFVTASGHSDLIDHVSISAVKQLATSTVRQSENKSGYITTDIDRLNSIEGKIPVFDPNMKLSFNKPGADSSNRITIQFSGTYKDDNGETVNIMEKLVGAKDNPKEYGEELAKALNGILAESSEKIENKNINECIQFHYDADTDKMEMTMANMAGYQIDVKNSSGLLFPMLGCGEPSESDEFWDQAAYNSHLDVLSNSFATYKPLDYLSDNNRKFTFQVDGVSKDIVLITSDEAKEIRDKDTETQISKIIQNVNERLSKAYGKDVVEAFKTKEGQLAFKLGESKNGSTLTITSDAYAMSALGLRPGASTKVNLSEGYNQENLKLKGNGKDYSGGIVINGVSIGGIDENTSISSILSKINSNKEMGVKATYVDATGQFMLISNETGQGRQIELDSELAKDLFGQKGQDGTYDPDAGLVKGQDAEIVVSYGNGIEVELKRSSNTFKLEGLDVTVSGVFGGEWSKPEEITAEDKEKIDKEIAAGQSTGTPSRQMTYTVIDSDGKETHYVKTWNEDTSAGVSFSAKADVDKVTEKMKKFFEDYNALVSEINTQVTTRPDSSYGPLTDAQKEEMSETSIENWEKKAKSGLLFNDGTMRDLSMDMQGIFSKMMRQTGLSYEDIQDIGISYSDNPKDGGVIVFDETKFRAAMEKNPEQIEDFFVGTTGNNGFLKQIEDTLTPYATRYATRNGNSYGRLIEEAGSEKLPTTLLKNQIYSEIKSKQDLIEQLRAKLKTEEDRYISMFTTMETMINQMNSQSSWLSQITG